VSMAALIFSCCSSATLSSSSTCQHIDRSSVDHKSSSNFDFTFRNIYTISTPRSSEATHQNSEKLHIKHIVKQLSILIFWKTDSKIKVHVQMLINLSPQPVRKLQVKQNELRILFLHIFKTMANKSTFNSETGWTFSRLQLKIT
jgi:hypothetical protein